jgi:energy-coupling factor transporter ATP-binding protein EcfA2
VTLTLRSVRYRHAGGTRLALDGVDLEVRDGEVLGVVGANDAGKSTLCLVAAGLAPRVVGGTLDGHVLVDGEDATDLPMHALVERVGIVFQNPSTQLSAVTSTVFEEVSFGPSNLGLPLATVLERTHEALDALEIADLAERNPARLSGGQQQLVALASILAMRPRHLILDEPTAQLDPSGTELVGHAIARLAANGAAILLVEHKTDLLLRLAARVVALSAGRVAAEGRANEVLSGGLMPDLGVAEPGRVRLERMLVEHGLDAGVIEGAGEPVLDAR